MIRLEFPGSRRPSGRPTTRVFDVVTENSKLVGVRGEDAKDRVRLASDWLLRPKGKEDPCQVDQKNTKIFAVQIRLL